MKKYMKEFTNNEWQGKLNKNGIEIELILSCNIESDNEPVLKIYFENELYCIHSLSTRQLIIVGNELLDNLNYIIVNSEENTIKHVYKYLDSFLNRDFVTELNENLNVEETMKFLGLKKYNM
jgi:hypothetical protein